MKSVKTAKLARPGKRDLFAELSEGFDALAARRQGKRRLRTHQVEAMNRVCESAQKEPDAFCSAAGRRVLQRTEW